MAQAQKNHLTHHVFYLSLWLKGLYGFLEIISGALLLLVRPEFLAKIFKNITRAELIEDPHDFIITNLTKFASHISQHTEFLIALYLMIFGLIKILLIIALLKRKLWAFPTAITIFLLFIFYQTYRYFIHPSILIFYLNILDIIIISLISIEYRKIKKDSSFQPQD